MSAGAYRMKAEAKLEEVQARLDVMRAKLKGASADARLDIERQIAEIEKSLAQARKRAERITNAADEAWADLARDLDLALEDVTATIKRFLSKLG